jgi:hypothetical protein
VTGGSIALPATPARVRMVELVTAAVERGRARGLVAKTVYLNAIDAMACGLTFNPAGIGGDPPRVLGLEVRRCKGKSKVVARGGFDLSIPAIVPNAATMTHWWRLRATLPDRHGQPLRIVTIGKLNSIEIEFWDGEHHIANRYAVRKIAA